MKGIVFTEFMDMVDVKFGFEVTESIVQASDLPSGGAYTAVGTYDHSEIVSLVSNLSKSTNIEISVLIFTFGRHLFDRFLVMFPDFFKTAQSAPDFLASVDSYIHMEVRKLYSDATLPQITTEHVSDDVFVLNYKSDRMMGDLAEGLIMGAIQHFGDCHECTRDDLQNEGASQCVRFTLKKTR